MKGSAYIHNAYIHTYIMKGSAYIHTYSNYIHTLTGLALVNVWTDMEWKVDAGQNKQLEFAHQVRGDGLQRI